MSNVLKVTVTVTFSLFCFFLSQNGVGTIRIFFRNDEGKARNKTVMRTRQERKNHWNKFEKEFQKYPVAVSNKIKL